MFWILKPPFLTFMECGEFLRGVLIERQYCGKSKVALCVWTGKMTDDASFIDWLSSMAKIFQHICLPIQYGKEKSDIG